jgi:hypothetical protein
MFGFNCFIVMVINKGSSFFKLDFKMAVTVFNENCPKFFAFQCILYPLKINRNWLITNECE